MDGFVLSMLIPVLETGALTLPALSVQVPGPAVWAAPSALSVTGAVQKSIVDSASAPMKVTVTSVLFQPFAFASGNWAAEAVGAVLSMLIPLTVALGSEERRVGKERGTHWAAASLDRNVLAGGVPGARLESASEQEKVTVTSVLFQPLAFASGNG